MLRDVDMSALSVPLKTATEVGIWQVANSQWHCTCLLSPTVAAVFFLSDD